MIQTQSQLAVGDNSGIQLVNCIQIKNKGKSIYIGQEIVSSIRLIKPKAKEKLGLKKGSILQVILIHSRSFQLRSDGVRLKFGKARVVPVKSPGKLYGTRILFPVPRELRNQKYMKIASLAPAFI
jgi:large subunit ribosomal protein L14